MGFDHVIPELMERIWRRKDPFPVYGLNQTRAFCYVTDAIEASQQLMTCQLETCEIVHIGNDREEITIQNLLEKLLDQTQFYPTVEPLPAPPSAVSRRCPDITKLRDMTGFHPRIGIDVGLSQTWQWYSKMFDRMR
jgi:UDP-glucose 4-epimerase/UDP-glucuronate decarboxylase